MTYAEFDFSLDPIIKIKINPIDPNPEEVAKLLSQMDNLFARNRRVILVYNCKDQKLISSQARIKIGEWVKSKRVQEAMKQNVAAIIVTDGNIWVQMLLKAVALIANTPTPIHVLDNFEAAQKVIQEKYRMVLG